MERLGIESRDKGEATVQHYIKEPPRFYTEARGYERVQSSIWGEISRVGVHRLAAVAEYGLEAVVDKDVHHRNGVPWDNRPGNLELIAPSEHGSLHAEERHSDSPWRDEETLREALKTMTWEEICDEWGCGQATLVRWRRKHGIATEEEVTR